MDILKSELGRNASAYFLVVLGMVTVGFGSHQHYDKMIDLGASLVTASLVAFQAKKSSDQVPPPGQPASPK